LIDIDPQAHASLHLGLDPAAKTPTVYDLLTDEVKLADVWQPTQCSESSSTPEEVNLSVAASHIDLAAAEVELAGVVGREVILRDKLLEAADDFDYVLIDCPPSLGILTINALSAVDDVFLPLQPHFLALHGLSKLLKTIGLVNERLNDRLQLAGVVLCLYDSGTRLAAEVAGDVDQFFREARKGGRAWANVRLFETRIRRNIRLAEAPSFGQSIFGYAPTSPGAEDYRALGGEMLAYYAGRAMLDAAAPAAIAAA
jgi:chromosome partitioning protein